MSLVDVTPPKTIGRPTAAMGLVLAALLPAGCFGINEDILVSVTNETDAPQDVQARATFVADSGTTVLLEQTVIVPAHETTSLYRFARPFACRVEGTLDITLSLDNGTTGAVGTAWPGNGCAQQHYRFILGPDKVEAFAVWAD